MTHTPNPFAAVTAMRDQLESGELTATALTSTYLQRIHQFNPTLHCYIATYEDDALRVATAADSARGAGHAVGPLHGIPIAIKDIIHMRGRVTSGGCKVWQERVSSTTATLVERLIGAGMVVLGKTHTVEFAMGSFGTNQHMGSPHNPWDMHHHRAAGGSSSGSAVAVAAGLAPWAIGTDTGGSVRIPSAWCGLTGLKTTIGRVSRHGVMPLSSTLDTPGPMCRSVDDTALLYRLLVGFDPLDPRTTFSPALEPYADFERELKRGVAGLRLAVMPASERANVCTEVLDAFDASLAELERQGAELEVVQLPESFQRLGDMVGQIIATEGYHFVGELIDDASLPIDDDIRPRIRPGRDVSAQRYFALLRDQGRLRAEFDDALAGFDALLTPTVADGAPVISEIDQTGTAAGFTRPVNFIEYCALALPNGRTSAGLPTSLQIVCGPNQELKALRIGRAFQQATDWHTMTPTLEK